MSPVRIFFRLMAGSFVIDDSSLNHKKTLHPFGQVPLNSHTHICNLFRSRSADAAPYAVRSEDP